MQHRAVFGYGSRRPRAGRRFGWIRSGAHPLERALHAAEGLPELRRDQKHLVGLTLGKAQEHLEVLIRQL
jgi:hypothetical protein